MPVVFVFAATLVLLFAAPRHTLGRACRIVEHNVTIAGLTVAAAGTVCPQLSGRWMLARWSVRDRLASLD